MKFQNIIENYKLALLMATLAIALLFFSNLALMLGWHLSQQKMRVFIPPQIPTSGINESTGVVPDETVFSFAYYIWQNINNWSHDGVTDYQNNLTQFAPFLTPRFHAELENDFSSRSKSGEVQQRLRSLLGMNGSVYSATDVESVGHGTWIVHLTMHLTERVKDTDASVKDVTMAYALRVVDYEISSSKNPWGLALDGFASEPERIATNV